MREPLVVSDDGIDTGEIIVSGEVQRDIGALEARMSTVEARLARIELKVDELVQRLAQASGGIRMLVAVGAIASTLGALVSKLLEWKSS